MVWMTASFDETMARMKTALYDEAMVWIAASYVEAMIWMTASYDEAMVWMTVSYDEAIYI